MPLRPCLGNKCAERGKEIEGEGDGDFPREGSTHVRTLSPLFTSIAAHTFSVLE